MWQDCQPPSCSIYFPSCKSVRANNCPTSLFHRGGCPKVIFRQYSDTCLENMESIRLGWALWDQRTTRVQNRNSAERVLRCRPDPRTSHTAFGSPHRATIGVWSWLVLGGKIRRFLSFATDQQILDDFLLALRVGRRRRMLKLDCQFLHLFETFLFHPGGSSLWCSVCMALSLSVCSRKASFSCSTVFLSALSGLHNSLMARITSAFLTPQMW